MSDQHPFLTAGCEQPVTVRQLSDDGHIRRASGFEFRFIHWTTAESHVQNAVAKLMTGRWAGLERNETASSFGALQKSGYKKTGTYWADFTLGSNMPVVIADAATTYAVSVSTADFLKVTSMNWFQTGVQQLSHSVSSKTRVSAS